MTSSSALFEDVFQARRDPSHPLLLRVREKLEDRLGDLKAPCFFRLSVLELQTSNDLAADLCALYDLLPTDSLFLGAIAGGDTLTELRTSLMEAEVALTGGASLRVAPMRRLEDIHEAMQTAGFSHAVTDVERIELLYDDIFGLMHDLRGLGLTNTLAVRARRPAPRRLFQKADEIYKERYAASKGGIAAHVDLFYMHGWREA